MYQYQNWPKYFKLLLKSRAAKKKHLIQLSYGHIN